jgi:L-threonylcarbamoyladenylate synthase
LESTVLDLSGNAPVILRPGIVTVQAIEAALGLKLQISESAGTTPKAPGMKYRHYAPKASVEIISGAACLRVDGIQKVAVMAPTEHICNYAQINAAVFDMGSLSAPLEIAQNFFAILRAADAQGPCVIYAERLPKQGVLEAVMNRLEKAAQGR